MMRGIIRWLLFLATVFGMLGLCGCAALFGYDRLPLPATRDSPDDSVQTYQDERLIARFSWEGPGHLIPTAHHPWGRVSRAVNPYGADVWCIRVRLERLSGDAPLVLLPERSTLQLDTDKAISSLTLAHYRRRWPKWAVHSDEEANDRQVAYAHVLDTLLIERQIRTGAPLEGLLVFARQALRDSANLRLPYKAGAKTLFAAVRWEFHR